MSFGQQIVAHLHNSFIWGKDIFIYKQLLCQTICINRIYHLMATAKEHPHCPCGFRGMDIYFFKRLITKLAIFIIIVLLLRRIYKEKDECPSISREKE